MNDKSYIEVLYRSDDGSIDSYAITVPMLDESKSNPLKIAQLVLREENIVSAKFITKVEYEREYLRCARVSRDY